MYIFIPSFSFCLCLSSFFVFFLWTSYEEPLTCKADTEFRCEDGSACIDIGARCNLLPDCTDGSDERDCGKFKWWKPTATDHSFCHTECQACLGDTIFLWFMGITSCLLSLYMYIQTNSAIPPWFRVYDWTMHYVVENTNSLIARYERLVPGDLENHNKQWLCTR